MEKIDSIFWVCHCGVTDKRGPEPRTEICDDCGEPLSEYISLSDILQLIDQRIEEYKKAIEDTSAPEHKTQLDYIRTISIGELNILKQALGERK